MKEEFEACTECACRAKKEATLKSYMITKHEDH